MKATKQKDRQKGDDVTSIVAALRAELGKGRSGFIEYIHSYTQAAHSRDRQGVLGCVRFLRWLGRADATAAETAILKALRHGKAVEGDTHYAFVFRSAVQAWANFYLVHGGEDEALAVTTRYERGKGLREILTQMALEGVQGVPGNFRKHFITIATAGWSLEPTATLGDLEIYADLGSDSLSRSKAARRKLRARYVEAFAYHEALYRFGRAVAAGSLPRPDSSPEACAVLREHIQLNEAWLRREGRFPGRKVVRTGMRGGLPAVDFQTWLEAGFDPKPLVTSYGVGASFQLALRGCTGPTQNAVAAVLGVLLCDTGWNEQPLFDLPRYPYAFVSSDHAAIATSPFIQGFKNRAGHAVVGYLDEGSLVAGARLDLVQQAWEHTRQELDPSDQRDGYATLQRNVVGEPSAYEVLERYRSMAEEFRERAGSKVNAVFENSLWINLTTRSEIALLGTSAKLPLLTNQPLFPSGVGWKVVRKTVLALHRDETGSMAATQTVAGHHGGSTIIPHYFNTPAVARKLDGDIRDFQEAVQAVLLFDEDAESVALKMALAPEKLADLRRHADASGITQILGLGPKSLPQGLDGEFVFTPTEENLQDLFLVLKSLRREQAFAQNRERFRQRILPMFVFVKALRRKLFQENLGRPYLAAARAALRRLNAGHIVLPALGYQNA